MIVHARGQSDSDVWFLQALKGRKKYDAVVGMGHAAPGGYQVRAFSLFHVPCFIPLSRGQMLSIHCIHGLLGASLIRES